MVSRANRPQDAAPRRTVAIAGSSGLIGTALVKHLRENGFRVIRLVRRAPTGPDEVTWDPAAHRLDPASLDGVHAVVNLAGAGIGDHRWTPRYKAELVSSRVDATATVVDTLLALDDGPRILVNGSAMGYYGDRGDQELPETASAGTGFIPDLVTRWEGEAQRAELDSGGAIRVAMTRTSLVMAPKGGAFGKLLPLLRLGLGGPLGDGKQWWSWITLADTVAAVEHLIEADVRGPVNLASPSPTRNGELTREIARAMNRPALLPAPGFALRAAVGEFSSEILTSARLRPEVLQRSGFDFLHATPTDAARWLTTSADSSG